MTTQQNPGNTPKPAPAQGLGFRQPAQPSRSGTEQNVQPVVDSVDGLHQTALVPRVQSAQDMPSSVDELIPAEPPRKKKRAGRYGSIINKSPHREEYLRLMQSGWTSFALSRYAAYRYGETIADSTFRTYKQRVIAQKPDWITPDHLTGRKKEPVAAGEVNVDVMGIRQKLAVLQMQRISVDVNTEMDLGKLFNSTGREVELLSKLLDQIKADQQDYGILPVAAQEVKVGVNDLPATMAPKHQTLGEALGITEADPAQLAAVARQLGTIVPIRRQREAG